MILGRSRTLVLRKPMKRCQTIGGWLPWWCNDWLVRHEWGPPCNNITWTKYFVRPRRSGWGNRWRLFPIYEWMEDWVPEQYDHNDIIIPTFGDPEGHLTGNQEIFILVNLSDWVDQGVSSYIPLGTNDEPNDRVYTFTGGICPNLPGFQAFKVKQGLHLDRIVRFNPDLSISPWEILRPELLFNGELRLLSEQTMDNLRFDGHLMAGDNNWDGRINMVDLARLADVYLHENIFTHFHCGNGTCEPQFGEHSGTCPEDCSDFQCDHDGTCEPWEDPDCLDCYVPCNFNSICDPGEDPATCPDCP